MTRSANRRACESSTATKSRGLLQDQFRADKDVRAPFDFDSPGGAAAHTAISNRCGWVCHHSRAPNPHRHVAGKYPNGRLENVWFFGPKVSDCRGASKTGKVCANKSGIMMPTGDISLSLGVVGTEPDCAFCTGKISDGTQTETSEAWQTAADRNGGPACPPLPEPVQSDKSTFSSILRNPASHGVSAFDRTQNSAFENYTTLLQNHLAFGRFSIMLRRSRFAGNTILND